MGEHPVSGLALGALLHHPDWDGVRVLAAPATGAGAVSVRDVRTVADLRADVSCSPGSLLAVGLSGDREDWHLDALLRRAAAADAAVVLLPGHDPLRLASRLLAERVRLTVLAPPIPSPPR
ncbi:hypothetical protein BJF90_40790 [Pseudonocardia sp. CNS-004]|nr:hypothetical protein BJF90_40790 [Pseudonocardia sp. CNS-004]